MPRFKDPYAKLGTVDDETAEERRKRERREYDAVVEDRALDLIKNDPEVEGDMRKAKKKARELLVLEKAYENGNWDPEGEPASETRKDAPSREGGDARRRNGRSSTSPRRTRPKSGTARRSTSGFVTKSARMVAAPYGSAASAAWTIGMGGLSLVFLYSLLTRQGAGAVSTFFRAIAVGISRFSDPYTPLFPSRKEVTPAPVDTKLVRAQAGAPPTKKVIRHGYRTKVGGPK